MLLLMMMMGRRQRSVGNAATAEGIRVKPAAATTIGWATPVVEGGKVLSVTREHRLFSAAGAYCWRGRRSSEANPVRVGTAATAIAVVVDIAHINVDIAVSIAAADTQRPPLRVVHRYCLRCRCRSGWYF